MRPRFRFLLSLPIVGAVFRAAALSQCTTIGPGNTAISSLPLAYSAALLGLPFFQQTVPLELDAQGALTAVHASNALAATVGTLQGNTTAWLEKSCR